MGNCNVNFYEARLAHVNPSAGPVRSRGFKSEYVSSCVNFWGSSNQTGPIKVALSKLLALIFPITSFWIQVLSFNPYAFEGVSSIETLDLVFPFSGPVTWSMSSLTYIPEALGWESRTGKSLS